MRFPVAPAAGLALVLLAGCAGSAEGTGEEQSVRLAVRDGALRALGADCAGAGPYLFIHAGAELTVTDAEGDRITEAVLPAGEAIEADPRDYGEAPREPTLCVFQVELSGLHEGESYTLAVDGQELDSYQYVPAEDGIAYFGYPAPAEVPTSMNDLQEDGR